MRSPSSRPSPPEEKEKRSPRFGHWFGLITVAASGDGSLRWKQEVETADSAGNGNGWDANCAGGERSGVGGQAGRSDEWPVAAALRRVESINRWPLFVLARALHADMETGFVLITDGNQVVPKGVQPRRDGVNNQRQMRTDVIRCLLHGFETALAVPARFVQ